MVSPSVCLHPSIHPSICVCGCPPYNYHYHLHGCCRWCLCCCRLRNSSHWHVWQCVFVIRVNVQQILLWRVAKVCFLVIVFYFVSLFSVVVGCAVRLFVCLSAGWLWKQKQSHTTTPAGITLIQVQLAIYPNRCMIYPVCIHYLRADRLTKSAYGKQMFDVVSLPVFHPYPPTHTHTPFGIYPIFLITNNLALLFREYAVAIIGYWK